MSRIEMLNSALLELKSGGVEAAAVLSEDGLVMASTFPKGASGTGIAALSGALLSLSSRFARELRGEDAEHIVIKGPGGCIIVMKSGAFSVLVAMTEPAADVAKATEYLSGLSGKIGSILSAD